MKSLFLALSEQHGIRIFTSLYEVLYFARTGNNISLIEEYEYDATGSYNYLRQYKEPFNEIETVSSCCSSGYNDDGFPICNHCHDWCDIVACE